MRGSRLLAVAALVAVPRLAHAQQPTAAGDSTRPAAVAPHVLPFATGRIQPGVRQYDVRMQTGDSSSSLGVRLVVTDSLTYAGRPAWRVVASGGRGVLVSADTAMVSRDSLRVLHWASVLGLSRLSVEIPADTLFGGISTPLGRRSLVLGLPRDVVVGKESFDLMLAALPLGFGWHDSVHVLQLDASTTEVDSVTLSVDGEEKVVTPAGEFDTWVVHLFAPVEPAAPPVVAAGTPDSARVATDSTSHPVARDSAAAPAPAAPPTPAATFWVDRRTGVVVREEQPIERLHGRLVRELVLAR